MKTYWTKTRILDAATFILIYGLYFWIILSMKFHPEHFWQLETKPDGYDTFYIDSLPPQLEEIPWSVELEMNMQEGGVWKLGDKYYNIYNIPYDEPYVARANPPLYFVLRYNLWITIILILFLLRDYMRKDGIKIIKKDLKGIGKKFKRRAKNLKQKT